MILIPCGGYSEFGRNMTALQDKGTIIIDMGLKIDAVMGEDLNIPDMTREDLYKLGAIPEPVPLTDVKGIVFSHGHMDHIGAASKLVPLYRDAEVVGTPMTLELLRRMFLDESKYRIRNKLQMVLPGNKIDIGDFSIEFIPASHSIPDSALIVVRSGEKTILYANDFKFDETPVLGYKTDKSRLRKLGNEGVDLMIFDVTRTDRPGRTPSEVIAQQKIQQALKKCDAEAIIATCFASHIARIWELMQEAKRMNRKPILLGRSMRRYAQAAVKFNFLPSVRYYGRQKEINSVFSRVSKNPYQYFIICTGNQGEKNSVMDRLARKEYDYTPTPEDWILFCSEIIPSEVNEKMRAQMETQLHNFGSKILLDLHVSGHCSREDTRELIKLVQAENLVPTHGSGEKMQGAAELAAEEGYKLGQNIHILSNGQTLEIY